MIMLLIRVSYQEKAVQESLFNMQFHRTKFYIQENRDLFYKPTYYTNSS